VELAWVCFKMTASLIQWMPRDRRTEKHPKCIGDPEKEMWTAVNTSAAGGR